MTFRGHLVWQKYEAENIFSVANYLLSTQWMSNWSNRDGTTMFWKRKWKILGKKLLAKTKRWNKLFAGPRGKNKKNIRQKSTKVWPSHYIQTRLFFASGDQGGAPEVCPYNLKTARDTAIRILSRYHPLGWHNDVKFIGRIQIPFQFFPSKQQKN